MSKKSYCAFLQMVYEQCLQSTDYLSRILSLCLRLYFLWSVVRELFRRWEETVAEVKVSVLPWENFYYNFLCD